MNIIEKINDAVLTPIVYLLFALAVGYFLYGLMKFIQNQDNETAQGEGKRHMVWGIVGIAIMVGVYGLLNLVQSSISGITP
jgi:uncharacterized membrane protein YidH (DUF202 family)